MYLLVVFVLLGAGTADGARKAEPVPRRPTGEYRTQGFFQAGTPGPKNIDSVSTRDFGAAERWTIDFSEPGKQRSLSSVPELQVQYIEEEQVLSDSGEMVVAKEPKFILKLRSIRKNALNRDRLAELARKSRHVKKVILYPEIEGGDTALEFILKANTPFRPFLEPGRLVLDLKASAG
jgi:hypothetical protein